MWNCGFPKRTIMNEQASLKTEMNALYASINELKSQISEICDQKSSVPDQNDNEEEDNDGELTYMGDILYYQDNAQLSKRQVNIYNINPEVDVTIKNLCVSCIKSSLVNSLGRMLDEESNSPDLVMVFKNTDFIPAISLLKNPNPGQFIPIGQLFFSFVSESQIAELARTYITANAYQNLKQSPLLTFCPNHTGILLKTPSTKTKLSCLYPGCCYALCPDCNKWHDDKSCPAKIPIPKGFRICPNCNRVIEKALERN